jgi:hypothetical protein
MKINYKNIIKSINDNLKNKNLNATIEEKDIIINKYIINYNSNNIDYIDDINNYITELIRLLFNKSIVIEDNIMFIY